MITGMAIAVGLHLAGITGYYGATHWFEGKKIRTVRFVGANELVNAPPLQDLPPPISIKIEVKEIIPATGIPIVVPDEQAVAEQTIQTQEEIKAAITAPAFTGDGGEEIRVDISPAVELLNDRDPDADEFVPVEQMPVIIQRIVPEYPSLARKANVEGKVVIRAMVDENGNVTRAMIVEGDDIFNQAALDAIYKTKFKPAINGNRAVKVWITYPVIFKIN
jgi:protein TonB